MWTSLSSEAHKRSEAHTQIYGYINISCEVFCVGAHAFIRSYVYDVCVWFCVFIILCVCYLILSCSSHLLVCTSYFSVRLIHIISVSFHFFPSYFWLFSLLLLLLYIFVCSFLCLCSLEISENSTTQQTHTQTQREEEEPTHIQRRRDTMRFVLLA